MQIPRDLRRQLERRCRPSKLAVIGSRQACAGMELGGFDTVSKSYRCSLKAVWCSSS